MSRRRLLYYVIHDKVFAPSDLSSSKHVIVHPRLVISSQGFCLTITENFVWLLDWGHDVL